MRKRLAITVALVALVVLLAAAIVVINQSYQLVVLADRIDPALGSIAFWSIAMVFGLAVLVPIFLVITLPAPLVPPESDAGPEQERHLRRLAKRLARNRHVSTQPHDLAQIEAALEELDSISEQKIRAVASQVFVTTAISQNGSLDGLVVLAAQTKLVLEIARVYYQRPTFRDLLYLYSNVAATAFVAAELEDVDVSEHVQPLVGAILGSGVGAIPGLGAAATLFVTSVATGAGNAYLTLRVGLITRNYCRAYTRPDRRVVRRSAALQAARLLAAIAKDGTASVASAVFAKPKKYFSDIIASTTSRVTALGDAAAAKSSSAWNVLTGRSGTADKEPGKHEPA